MLYLSGKMGVISIERMLWILNTTHHRRIMKYYNSLEKVNSKKTKSKVQRLCKRRCAKRTMGG